MFRKKKTLHGLGKELSFCITHMNRFDDLSKTLPMNLKDNIDFEEKIEFVLIDFENSDMIRNWIWHNFPAEIQSGYLAFYQTNSLKKWSAPIAKNNAHLLGKGAILTNLDCDNYVGKNGASIVLDAFEKSKNEIFLWQFTGVKRDGTYGRMSISRKEFYRLGGYNEKFLEMGYQDNDLMNRAIISGIRLVKKRGDQLTIAIKNEKYKPENMSFKMMDAINTAHSWSNVLTGRIKANRGTPTLLPGIMKMDRNGSMKPNMTNTF